MKFDEIYRKDLERYSIVRLTQIFLLANSLNLFISDKKDVLDQKKIEIYNHPLSKLPDLMSEANSEGIKTISDFLQLQEKNPERYEKIFTQSGLMFSKTWTEVESNLFQHLYPNILWASLFIIAISHLEYCLQLYCDYAARVKTLPRKVQDISGNSTYEKFVTYNSKVIQNNFEFNNSIFWQNIRNHRAVRNLLVHNNGLINNSNKAQKVKNLINSGKVNLGWNENMVLEFTKDYLRKVIEDIQNWMQEYFKKWL